MTTIKLSFRNIKDGKVFNEIIKGNSSRKDFFDKIIDVVTLLGGEENDNY